MTHAEIHDPTSSATLYPAHPTAPTSLSRNEIETLCLKAARGAGMSWGLAEEASFVAGWLAVRDVDGAAALLAHLQNLVQCAIAVRDRLWMSTSDVALCPILLGAALDDHAALEAGLWSAPITIKAVNKPILLVPFMARAAKVCAKPVALTWPSGSLIILASGDVDPTAPAALSRVDVSTLAFSPTPDAAPCKASGRTMVLLSAATIENLNILALHTTVPASDTSRRGARAATSDND